MDEVSLIKASYSLIKRDFGLQDDVSFENASSYIDRIKELLAIQINYLLDHDFNELLNILYRIDIPEEKVREALLLSSHGAVATHLVELVLERQQQKAITRLKYRQE